MGKKIQEKKREKETIGITAPKKEFQDWYPELVQKAGLADYAPVGGCMVIKPYGYSIWEKIQQTLDRNLKDSGHVNAYFPLFIPEKFLKKEAEHFSGFKPEVAWIEDENEKYALRPTSETIIYDSYSKWIRSWRDLPLLINQWCNIIRWETKVTRLFLRTREFLWQEGHTAHASCEEADKEVMLILKTYTDLIENCLAIPILTGKKSEAEKFAGALYTATMEALMPDGKALQMGTSHNLGQNFSKAFDIKFLDRDEKEKYVWQTSWAVTTRLIGALTMVHGDDKGLILPPKIAPIQIVIIPIPFKDSIKRVLKEARALEKSLSDKFSVKLDDRESYTPGWKYNEWEMKGIPLRIEIGPKDVKKKQVVLVRRDTGNKLPVKTKDLPKKAGKILDEIQKNLFRKAKKFLQDNTKPAGNFQQLKTLIKSKKMAKAGWCGSPACEAVVKDETGATIRLLPFKKEKGPAKCVKCGKPSKDTVYFAKAY